MKAFLPEGWLLPWWVVLLVTCYLLLKAGLSLEHPCSVLGVWSPVTRGQISKRYREISMCTHPDKLLGHTADEVERGKLLFQRASEARDGLIAATRESAAAIERAAQASALDGGAAEEAAAAQAVAQASCSTQLDEAIYQGLSYLVETSREVRGASRRSMAAWHGCTSHGCTYLVAWPHIAWLYLRAVCSAALAPALLPTTATPPTTAALTSLPTTASLPTAAALTRWAPTRCSSTSTTSSTDCSPSRLGLGLGFRLGLGNPTLT